MAARLIDDSTFVGAMAKSRSRIACDVLRKMSRVFADAMRTRRLEFVEPRQAENGKAAPIGGTESDSIDLTTRRTCGNGKLGGA
jgi:hypothetical protein